MTYRPAATLPVSKGPAEYFSGEVLVKQLQAPVAPSRAASAEVTFQPGARTFWHTHPLGQTIIVTAGEGLFQLWGEAVVKMSTGDVVTFAPGVKHWHGAGPSAAMTHIAIHEVVDGSSVTWLEVVA
jgi:quercetin dioxygenase-like cupin family protein